MVSDSLKLTLALGEDRPPNVLRLVAWHVELFREQTDHCLQRYSSGRHVDAFERGRRRSTAIRDERSSHLNVRGGVLIPRHPNVIVAKHPIIARLVELILK